MDSALAPCVGPVHVFALGTRWSSSLWCRARGDSVTRSQPCVLCLVLMEGDGDIARNLVVILGHREALSARLV